MWNLIKNDPILKTIFIFILGIFSFSFAFSLMFGGSGGTGAEHGSGTAGYSAATGLSQIIILLSKILIIVLLVAIIIAAVKFVKRHIIGNEPIKGLDPIKNKPIQTVLAGLGGIILLFLAFSIMAPPSAGTEMAHATTSSMTTNIYGIGLAGVAAFLIKFVAVLSLIGLIAGLMMYVKDRYVSHGSIYPFLSKESCSECGVELKSHWQCCPSCGTEKYNNHVIEIPLENNGKN